MRNGDFWFLHLPVLALCLTSGLGQLCPEGWLESPFTDFCFQFNSDKFRKTWTEARGACQSRFGDLAWYENTEEKQFVIATAYRLFQIDHRSSAWWLGLNGREDDNEWTWVTGEALDTELANWNVQERSAGGGKVHTNCGVLRLQDDTANVGGGLLGTECYTVNPYICKRAKAAVDNCAVGWQQIEDSCFKFFDLEKEWKAASADCNRHGAQLATVENDVQQQYIYDIAHFQDKPVWIGYSSWSNESGSGWKKNEEVLPPFQENDKTNPEFWTEDKRPQALSNQDNNTCVEVVPSLLESRKSWVPIECSRERSYMCKTTKGHCATGWVLYNGSCYQLNNNIKLSWFDADVYCKSQGAELVTIQSQTVQGFVSNLVQNSGVNNAVRIWLGASDVDQNPKVLRWPNKVEVANSFTNWAKSTLLQSRQSLCVDMVAGDGKWGISDKCLNQQNFICQISDRKVVNPPTVLPANGSCDPAWKAYSFSCYFFSQDDSKSWLEAQRACEDERAYLVKVDDVREMSFISGKLVSSSWIGVNDRETEGQWVWHDNTVATYNNWAPDKPDNVDSGSEAHCGTVLFGNAKGLWDDVRCNEHRAYICEKMIGPVIPFTSTSKGPSFTAKCGMFWEDDSFSEYCYQVNVGTLSWNEARLQCQHNGGDLASVTSLREQQYIAGKLGAISDMRYYWLGGNDLRYQNVWTWNDGAAFAYLNWAKGHPNSEQRKDCMEIDAFKTEWKSEDCRQRRGYICKKKGHVTVTMSTVTTVDIGYPYCTDGWKHYDQSCYKVVKDKKQWSLAINACRREGSDLVSILSANENNFVSSLTGEMGYDPKEFWLGLNSKRMFNQYEWTDDSMVTFTNWKEREPSGHLGNGQCVSLLTTAEDIGKWKNNDCDQWLPYICKKFVTRMVSPPTVTYDGCNKTAVGYRGSCYTVSNSRTTWTEAGRLCNGSGGYLLTLNDHLEQAYISGLIGNKATDTEYWMGLSKGSVENSYKWLAKNSQSTFTNWNKFHTGNEEYVCVAVSKTPDITGEWVDRKCSQRKLFICEYPRAGYVGDTPTTPSVSYECPEGWGWREFGDFCYKRYHHRGGYSWYEGRDFCRTIGGDLASFHSEIHLWNASDVSKYALRSPDIFWIGLSKPDKKTGHIWSDGSALDFTYWKDGEPNDHNGQEDCVEMNRHLGRWSDVNCYASRGVLCQLRKGDPLLTTVTATTPTPASQCGSHSKWFAYKDYCYTVSQSYGTNEVVSWQDARGQCLQSGGDLASIHDSEENDFVLYIASHKSFASKYWIGLNELDLESYKWSDGTATDYTSWSLNEPNDLHGGQKCVIFITETGHWSDENCGEALSYICKKHKDSSTTATPTPTPVIHGQCPVGFHGIGNKCYLIQGDGTDVSTLKNWTEAIDACATLNSKYTLASITNPLEEALVTTLLKGKTVDFWLGISMFWVGTRHRMRKFQWTDNTKVDFLYWDHGEPNGQSYGADMENCVSISTKTLSVGHWQDRKCAIRMGYVCQAWKDPTLTTQAPTQATTSCPLGYLSFGDACYQMTSPMTWEVAKVTCERQQDTLVSIMDGYEQAFLMLVTQQPPQPIWLGIYRNGSTYQWVDGWPADYLNWASIAPIGIDPSKCIALMPGGRWNDMPCTANLPSVCKRTSASPPAIIPEPKNTGQCPSGNSWRPYGHHCYQFNQQFKRWGQANFHCYKQGGTLASITSQGIMRFIVKTLREMKSRQSRKYYIGLVRKFGGSFGWEDGSLVNYLNWEEMEPSNNTEKNCATIHPGNGGWQAANCLYFHNFICKIAKIPVPTTPGPACREDWFQRDNMCYKAFFKTGVHKETWENARLFCQSEGGNLASFHSSEEIDWFMGRLKSTDRYSLNTRSLWIGLHLAANATDGANHTWSDGTANTYAPWGLGEPDNHNGREMCVSLFKTKGTFRDDNCAAAKGWICKTSVTATPMPSTITTPIQGVGNCGETWNSFGEHCYYVSEDSSWTLTPKKSWFKARQWCLENAGDLLSIQTTGEEDFVTTLVSKTQYTKFWIGANSFDLQGYRWADGSPMIYINWAKGEPNSVHGSERCVNIHSGKDNVIPGTFNDDNCADKMPFICKKHQSSKTTGTMATTPPISGYCPRGFHGVGNRCYKFFGKVDSERKTWEGAAAACSALGKEYSLASITNPLEQGFVTSYLQDTDVDLWIGLSSTFDYIYARRHVFRWLTNEEVSFVNWDVRSPTLGQSNDRECVKVRNTKRSLGRWVDVECSQVNGYICQTWKDSRISTPWTPAVSTSGACKSGYTTYNGQACYKLYMEAVSWEQARDQCTDDGTLLAFVPDHRTEANIQLIMAEASGQPAWIGLKDMGQKNFSWVNEWPLTYTNWDQGQPKAAGQCGVITPNAKWRSSDCNDRYLFVCMSTEAKPPTTTVPLPGWCPEGNGWIEYGASCFFYDAHAYETWAGAKFECYKRGGQLASFANQDEVDFILGLTKSESTYRNLWIGLIRRFQDEFVWVDGTPFDFTNWSPGQPRDQGRSEDCVEFKVTTGEWDDIVCNRGLGFICKTPKIRPTASVSINETSPLPTESGNPTVSPETNKQTEAQMGLPVNGGTVAVIVLCLVIACLLAIIGFTVFRRRQVSIALASFNKETGDTVAFSYADNKDTELFEIPFNDENERL